MFTDHNVSGSNQKGLLDAFNSAVLLIDPKGFRIIEANQQARELLGVPIGDMEGKATKTEIFSSLPIGAIENLDDLISKGEGSVVVQVRSEGAVMPYLVEARSFIDGNSERMILTLRKVDDLGKKQLELDRVRKEHNALMETITEMVFTVDRSGTIVSVNRAVRGLGFKEDEFIGAKISSFVTAGYREAVSEIIHTIFTGGSVEQSYSIEVMAKDGELHLLRVKARLVIVDGVPALVQCIARDITPLVEADKALGESLWQYRSLFENAHVAMWEVEAFEALAFARDTERETCASIQEAIASDPIIVTKFMDKLRFIDVNHECLDLFHASSRDELYQGRNLIFPDDSLPTISAMIGSMLVGNSGTSGECVVRTLDGKERSVMLRWGSLQSQINGHRRMLLSFLDTTDKMMAFKQLESEKHFVDAIIDFAETLIIGMDMEGTITIFNRKAEQSTGFTREEVLGRNYFALFDTEMDSETSREWLEGSAKSKASLERIKVLPGRIASPLIWWHNTVVESGDRLVMIGIGVDITERVSLNNRMEDLNNSLLLLNRIMRHDIMNDLSVALGSIQLYEKKREDRFLEAAAHSLTKSVDLIHDISDLERLREPTKLRLVRVRDMIDRVVAKRIGQNITIKVNGEATAMADETLSSVLDNLVGNAFMHGHSEVVDIDVGTEAGQCIIRVADHGTGVPEDIKERIFDEGFKFGESGNTGFGLYIVKKTMERYGGSVVVKDNNPHGAIFELRLMLSPPS